MPAYVIIQGHITDTSRYDEYKTKTPATLNKYGGKFIVRGGAAEDLEGKWDTGRVVILEFPSVEAAKRWYNSPEYREARAIRAGAANMTFTVVEGV